MKVLSGDGTCEDTLMFTGLAWLPDDDALLSGAGLACGTLASAANGGGGPMESGGTRNVTPVCSNMAPPAMGSGSTARFLGGKAIGFQILGQSALK